MAGFKFDGIDYLQSSFEQLSRISDDEKYSVLEPAAELLAERLRETLRSRFRKITGALADSIKIQKKSDDSGAYAHITLTGKHPGSSTGKRHKKGRSSGKYSGTNAEIGYILEYGSPRIPATHWMEETNDAAADEVIAAEQEAWDQLLTEKGL